MTTTNDIDATRDWTGRIDDKTIVERTAQAVALRHIGLLTAFDGIDTADELYEQAETAERYDISKALEASNDTAEIQAVRERLGQIVEQIRTGLPAAAEVEKARAERDEYAHDNNRLVAKLVKVRAQLTDANRALDGYKADERSQGRAALTEYRDANHRHNDRAPGWCICGDDWDDEGCDEYIGLTEAAQLYTGEKAGVAL